MNISQKLKRPALLLGNGLNNYCELPVSWHKMLVKISGTNETEDVLAAKDISYPEFFDALSFRKNIGEPGYASLKERIAKEIQVWDGLKDHVNLCSFALSEKMPILTTNYDKTLHRYAKTTGSGNIPKIPDTPKKIPSYTFTDYYPWGCYYSDHEISNALAEFAIWHIHGMACYRRSLAIGAIDYGNYIHRFKDLIHHKKKGLYALGRDQWPGKNTWIDVFLHCDLIIVGLSLESQETSLRWLQMEREKYYRSFIEQRRKTFFVSNKKYDNIGKGKRYFLDSLNINIEECKSGKEIYGNWERK